MSRSRELGGLVPIIRLGVPLRCKAFITLGILLQNYTHTPIVLPQSWCTIEFLDKSHISEPALELHSRPMPSVGGITNQWVLTQREIPEKGRKKCFHLLHEK